MNPTPGRIIEVYNEASNRIGLVEFDGKRRAIYLSLVPEAQVGDDVLFHAGFATERVKRKDAQPNAGQPAGGEPEVAQNGSRNGPRLPAVERTRSAATEKLIPLAQDKQFESGQIIFPAGATSSFLHLIVSGDVALEAVSEDHTEQVQALHAGDAMGWSALTGDSLTHFQARAQSPVSTVAFPGEQLSAACEQRSRDGLCADEAAGGTGFRAAGRDAHEIDRKSQRPKSAMNEGAAAVFRKRIEVRGIVQGVGFRPFVYRIASRCDIRGSVLNSSDGVVIEAEGSERRSESFLHVSENRTSASGADRAADGFRSDASRRRAIRDRA